MKIELQNVNTCKLHDELIKAGIVPQLVESLDNMTWITIEDSQQQAVMEVVAKHNPTPIPQQPTENERLNAIESVISAIMGV